MDRIIIHGGPVSPVQHVYVYVNGEQVDTMGVQMDNLAEVVFALAEKHNIKAIDLAGSRFFMEGVERELRESELIKNYSIDFIAIRYV